MNLYLGLDLGTSWLKAIVIDENGENLSSASKEIQITSPQPGHAEENPADWWKTFGLLLKQMQKEVNFKDIKGIGLSGQMHGVVCYDDNHEILRPAIIWADKRSATEVEEILKLTEPGQIYETTGNPIFTGFMLPSLLWVKKNEPHVYGKIYKVSSPKDYIAYKLTGELKCEPSDALATACFDYEKGTWSSEILKEVGINESFFPEITHTSVPYGKITAAISKETGLPSGIPVFGGSDQSMAAMGCGLIEKGQSLLAVSTGGQFLVISDKGFADPKRRLHTLNHGVEGISMRMAATLAAGLSLKWFKTNIMQQLDTSYNSFIQDIDTTPLGANGLMYMPFLAGERTPYFNAKLKGAFIGTSLEHNRLHFIRAIMEGVAFSFREGLESFQDTKIQINNIILSGGGTKNATWRQIITDVLGIPTQMINIENHSPFGAAIYSKFAQEGFRGLKEFYEKVIVTSHKLTPDPENHKKYSEIYKLYKKHAIYLNDLWR